MPPSNLNVGPSSTQGLQQAGIGKGFTRQHHRLGLRIRHCNSSAQAYQCTLLS